MAALLRLQRWLVSLIMRWILIFQSLFVRDDELAICDQLEDPKLTKKLVKRGITELVTPGVALADNVLNYKENNFFSCHHFGKASCGVAFLDISTGEFLTGEGSYDTIEKFVGELLDPRSVVR